MAKRSGVRQSWAKAVEVAVSAGCAEAVALGVLIRWAAERRQMVGIAVEL